MNLLISGTAAMAIARETAFHGDLETGGILLGRRLSRDACVVTVATDGGVNATRQYTSFSPDTEYLNSRIEQAARRGLRFLGEWHRHPGSMSVPSAGDENTISQTMLDSGLGTFEAIIVNVGEGNLLRLYAYHYERGNGRYQVKVKILDDEEVGNLMPWFDMSEGKERLLFDSRIMRQRFPDFKLNRKGDQVMWAGEYSGHKIVLVYPSDFPKSRISVEIEPSVQALADEPEPAYAAIAAELALIRIESLAKAGAATPRPTAPSTSPSPAVTVSPMPSQWYESSEGQGVMRKLDTYFGMVFPTVNTFKLPNGNVAFSCVVKDFPDVRLIFSFPNDFPHRWPEARAKVGNDELPIEAPREPPIGDGLKSIEVLVRRALSQLERSGRLPRRPGNLFRRMFGLRDEGH